MNAHPVRRSAASGDAPAIAPRVLVHRANTIREAIVAAQGVELDLRSPAGTRDQDICVAHSAGELGYRLYDYLMSVLRSLETVQQRDFVFAFNVKETGLAPALDHTLQKVRQYFDLLAWDEARPGGLRFFTFDIPGAEIPEYARLAPFGRISEYETQCKQRHSLTGALVDSFTGTHQDALLEEAARLKLPIALISRTLREGPSATDAWPQEYTPRFVISKIAPLVRKKE